MVYRTVRYTGETLKGLVKRIDEVKERGEEVMYFSIVTFDTGE